MDSDSSFGILKLYFILIWQNKHDHHVKFFLWLADAFKIAENTVQLICYIVQMVYVNCSTKGHQLIFSS